MRVSLVLATCLALAPASTFAQSRLDALTALSGAFQALAERVNPSVVQVLVSETDAPSTADTPAALMGLEHGNGSGVILDPDGFIVTNAHVVKDARQVQVQLARSLDFARDASLDVARDTPAAGPRRSRLLDATIVGIDTETDIAVLKIDRKELPALPMGDSDALRQGQLVFAFGSPMDLENSVTMGVVSAVGRQLDYDDPMVYVQTDAPINPGNSGGPLVDSDGRVVGLNTLIVSQSGGSEGLGFAAPVNIVRPVFEQLKTTGRVRRGTIGVYAQTVTPTLAAGLRLAQDWGVVLGDVYSDGTGAAAGLQVGDVVVALDGKPVENGHQFEVNLYRRKVGDTVTLDVQRGTRALRLSVPVKERDDDPARFAEFARADRHLVPRLGILAVDLTDTIRARLEHRRADGGVLVAAYATAVPEVPSGPEPGDVILALNGTPVPDLATLRTLVAALPARGGCVLQIQRGGDLMYLAFELP